MYICIHIYIYVHIYIHMYTYIYIYICIHIHICMYIYTCILIYICIYIYIRTYYIYIHTLYVLCYYIYIVCVFSYVYINIYIYIEREREQMCSMCLETFSLANYWCLGWTVEPAVSVLTTYMGKKSSNFQVFRWYFLRFWHCQNRRVHILSCMLTWPWRAGMHPNIVVTVRVAAPAFGWSCPGLKPQGFSCDQQS